MSRQASSKQLAFGPMCRRFLALALIVRALVGQGAYATCPAGWQSNADVGRCYKHVNQRLTWSSALSVCARLNGTLANVLNEGVERAVQEAVGGGGVQVHIGLRFNHATWQWLWTDGSRATYYNWAAGIWNRPHWGPCVATDQGRWQNIECDEDLRTALCERPFDSTSAGTHATAVSDFPTFPFLNGWTRSKLRSYKNANGRFPPLTEYLSAGYMRRHLSLFEKGASFLDTADHLAETGRELLGDPDVTWVVAKEDMDEILKNANGHSGAIEQALGIPSGLWAGKDIRRIGVPNPRALHLRMATGNEIGANELWLPGGYLPTGIPEATIDRVPKGMYTESVVPIVGP